MEFEKTNEEISKLQEINSKLSSQIMSLQEQMETILRKNANYLKELSEKSNKIFEMQKTIENYKKQEKIYDNFNQLFPNKNPEEILNEIELQNQGHHQLFSDYEDLRLELKRIKIEKENYEKLYKESLSGNNNLNDYNDEKTKNDLKKYKNKVYELEDDIEKFKDYKKENEYLHNMLFQIYNLLFDTFRLDRNIKIDKKYNFIKEEDFKPNIFCNPEIGSYVKLMIKSMKESSTGQELRETIAFANMLVRNYLPDKLNLRYKPVEILNEIKNLVDDNCEKLKKIEGNYKLVLEKNRNLEKEINIMKGKVKKEEIKFEKYQKIVDKIVTKDNKQNNKDNNKNNNNMNSNSNITKNKNKIQYSVECGRKKIVPREKYFINASQKNINEEEKKNNKRNLRYKLVKGKDDDINEGIVFKDQKIYMYTPKYDDNDN
jgi:hypothetical protein